MPITKRYTLAWRSLFGRNACHGIASVGKERSRHSLRKSILLNLVSQLIILAHNQGGLGILAVASQAQLEALQS